MKRTLLNYLAAIIFATSVGGGAMVATVASQPVSAASCNAKLLTFPTWYRGLTDGNCNIKSPNASGVGGMSGFIWTIVLNVIEIVLQLVAYLSVGYIIWGGFRYMTSTGTPDKMAGARKTIVNASVGLIISIASVMIVNVIAGAIR